jgi:hypothetical protein
VSEFKLLGLNLMQARPANMAKNDEKQDACAVQMKPKYVPRPVTTKNDDNCGSLNPGYESKYLLKQK